MQFFRACLFISTVIFLGQQPAFAADVSGTGATLTVEELDVDTPTIDAEFEPSLSQPGYSTTEIDNTSPTGKDMLSEVIIRPMAVVGSATGFVIFIAASPFSGLASIPEPHDSFKTTWNDFVVTPYQFAFRRPLGDYSVELNQ